jgi:glutaredoxin 3
MGRVTVFSIASCPHCQRAKALLTRRGVPFHDVSLTDYPEKRADMLQLADRLTVPQIFFNDAHVGGASDLDVLIAATDGDAAPKSFDDVMKAVLAAPDSEDLRLRIPDHAPEPAPTPSPRTHPPVVTIGGRALSYLDAVRELLAAGLDISDRAYNLTVYRRCFVGSQVWQRTHPIFRHAPVTRLTRLCAPLRVAGIGFKT